MGAIIDTENVENIYRCNYVKIPIIFISLIGAPLSILFLIIDIIKMLNHKKNISFLTLLIILIFFSEIINCISKLLQLVKYFFPDLRSNRQSDRDNQRGIICQIQIATSLFSDYFTLLCTLLLSLRCHDVINYKKRFFDNIRNRILSVVGVIIGCIVLSIGFLFLDRKLTEGNQSYRYDLRDRCSYWCWLDHVSSLICYGFYWIILLFNIIYAVKTNNNLKKEFQKLVEDNTIIEDKNNIDNFNESEKMVNNSKNSSEEKVENKKIIISKEGKKRIEDLILMRVKCKIYPLITIIIWVIAVIYRVFDDFFMFSFDSEETPEDGTDHEKDFFQNYVFFQIIVQALLVFHAILASFRGIFYGISFMVFEEKAFNNFFRRIWKKYKKNDPFIDRDSNKEIIIESNNNSTLEDFNKSNDNNNERNSNFEQDKDNEKENIELSSCDEKQ